MSKILCKGNCGHIATYKGWCKTKWQKGKRYCIGCPRVEKKRGKSISKYRVKEAKLGKNPMQNPEICKKNHSLERNKKASRTLKKLGKLGLLPQQKESAYLKRKRRKNVSRKMKQLLKEGKHPLQLQTEEQKKKRFEKLSKTLEKQASEGKLFMQNMTKKQKRRFGKKISKTLRKGIQSGRIKLATGWKKVPYRGIVLRSDWEKQTAAFLDKNKIKWGYEPFALRYFDTTRRLFANTIPDFYLPKYKLIIEVKSNAKFKSKQTKDKIRWIEKQGYRALLFGRKEIKQMKENEKNIVEMIKNERS